MPAELMPSASGVLRGSACDGLTLGLPAAPPPPPVMSRGTLGFGPSEPRDAPGAPDIDEPTSGELVVVPALPAVMNSGGPPSRRESSAPQAGAKHRSDTRDQPAFMRAIVANAAIRVKSSR